MKLAIVSETFPPEVNGVSMTFGTIVRELSRLGHDITVYRPDRPDLLCAGAQPTYREVALPGFPIPGYGVLRGGWPAWGRLVREWRTRRPDLVHVVTEGPLGASAVTAARRLRIPVTSSFHTNFHCYTGDYGAAFLRRFALSWLRRVHNRTRVTFAPTAELCAELEQQGFRNLRVLSRGVDLRHFSPTRRDPALRRDWGAGDGEPVVLHVGRMAAEKNYPELFRVYDAMRMTNPRLRFVLAGEGPLKARLQRENPECIFAGFYSREEIGRYYASADIYVHASRTETFGNVLTEAMASGLAIAGYDYAAARQFVRHGENGLVAPFDSPDMLRSAAVSLAREPALRERLRRAAPESVASQSWEQVIARFEADLRMAASAA